MKSCFGFLFFLLFPLFVLAQVNWANEPVILKEIKGEAIKSVSVKTLYGNITVIGTSARPSIEVYVDAINESTASKEELKQLVKQDYTIDMVVKNHQLMVTASCKLGEANWKKALSISFKIFVPKSVTCDLKSKIGMITLVKLDGNQTFATNGAIKLDAVNGNVKGQSEGGTVNIANSGSDIDINTKAGDIIAVDCKGKLNIRTGGGDINLSRLKGTIEASTAAGRIEGDEVDGDLKIQTNSGNVTLKRMSGHLVATVGGGNVNAELDKACKSVKININAGDANISLASKQGFNLNLEGKSVTASDMPSKKFNGNNDSQRINGAIYGGGIPVDVHTATGKVNLKFI
ncbi:DUF4097 domain-containing protein [Mucilaginibacter sp. RS28]|uniref:DUF4097 domain-containing protein n=1 Tax=Mucilaginibacter straminoryzae TaxID=2932774 RepID=A0A9X1X642_9SPHI|nr:DUF4097 family beta strand repeat-containing protein [Mucilaginibacter straminoryzae]MCJ8211251.1 DUF4097 domain-containing protein [Mucilaginibacter straminoryzae]